MTNDTRRPREWWVETESIKENRAFEINNDRILLEYKGRPPAKPVHVIEYSAYEAAIKRAEAAEKELYQLAGDRLDGEWPIVKQLQEVTKERDELRVILSGRTFDDDDDLVDQDSYK